MLILASLILVVAPFAVAREPPVVNVGVVYDGGADDHSVLLQERRAEYFAAVVAETRALTRRDFDVRFPESKRLSGDWTREGIRRALGQLLADPEVDLVVSLAPMATNELAHWGTLDKPVVGAWAVDIQAQRLPFERGSSGVPNFNYLIAPGSILRDLRKFREVIRYDRLHILTDRLFAAAIPEIPQTVIAAGEELGVEIELVAVDTEAGAVLEQLPADTEAIYITPLLRMRIGEQDRLIAELQRRLIPTFSLLGEIEVRRGVLGGMRTEASLSRIARRLALNIQRILEGEDAGTLPVVLDQPERLMINMATARSIGYYPSWRVLIEAVQINPEAVTAGPELSLDRAVHEAIEANLGLRAAERGIVAESEAVALARSAFRPRLDLFAQQVRIDDDRAAASFGSQAETTTTAGAGLSQLLYSDEALGGIKISRRLLEAVRWRYDSDRLDVTLDTATTYLRVLLAQALERVERDNLRLTESNLDVARRRERIGISGLADVYRWESALATQRASLIAAGNRVEAAKIAVNRLRNRPLEEPFSTVALGMDETWLITAGDRIRPYADDPARFRWLREFYVREGLQNSVELKVLDASIAARERALRAARRRNKLPTLSLRGDWEDRLERSGAGASGPVLPPMFGTLPQADDRSWSVALRAGLPLFEGGARAAEVRRLRAELEGLRLERTALVQAVETRIRAGMLEAGSTFPAIELAREAADAADRNLELVTDAYSRGAVSIIELLDAQNAALAAREQAVSAVFEFLLDLMEVQRASNTFDFFLSADRREAFFGRMQAFYEAGGIQPRR